LDFNNLKKNDNMKDLNKLLLLILLVSSAFANGQTNELKENVEVIKKKLVESKEKIKKYEWIETITVFIDGEQKSVKQNQCYYGVDGKLTKVATGATTPEKKKPGLRGKIVENKKEEMNTYVESAMAKIKTYIPPQAEKIQKVYAGGKVVIHIIEPGKKFKVDFPDYSQAGDMVAITLDKPNKLLLSYSVNTFVEDAKDPVSLNVVFKTLPDGTSYVDDVTFNSESKKIKIVMQNSGYKASSGR